MLRYDKGLNGITIGKVSGVFFFEYYLFLLASLSEASRFLSFFEFCIRLFLDLATGFSCLLYSAEPFIEGVCRILFPETGTIEHTAILVIDECYAGDSVLSISAQK